jgi:hypothetical protein
MAMQEPADLFNPAQNAATGMDPNTGIDWLLVNGRRDQIAQKDGNLGRFAIAPTSAPLGGF